MSQILSNTYWVQVPAGKFQMGLSFEEAKAFVLANAGLHMTDERISDELPAHQKHLQGFYLGKQAVTNELFQQFVDANGYAEIQLFTELLKDYGARSKDILPAFVDKTKKPGPSQWRGGHYPEGQGEHPVHGISFYEAAACARFFNLRLPTETEWEYAARYNDGRHFPWGNLPTSTMIANFSLLRQHGTTACGSFRAGTSALMLEDLAGNVHEWVNSLYQAYPGGELRKRFLPQKTDRVARGGSFNGDIWSLRCTSRFAVNALDRFKGLGMRLAKSTKHAG